MDNGDVMAESQDKVWEASHNMGQKGMRYEAKSFSVAVGAPGYMRWNVDYKTPDGEFGTMVVFLDTEEAARTHVADYYGYAVIGSSPYLWGKAKRDAEAGGDSNGN